jgi:methionyl-tRNA synthetase
VSGLLDNAEISQALDYIWQRVRRLNRYVEEQAPWTLAKDEARAGELDTVLATLVEGLRAVTVVLHPYLPFSTQKLLAALGESDTSLAGAALRPQAAGVSVTTLEPLFPKL